MIGRRRLYNVPGLKLLGQGRAVLLVPGGKLLGQGRGEYCQYREVNFWVKTGVSVASTER